MPVADLPHSEELTAFRQQLQEIIDGRWDEDSDAKLCSKTEAPAGRTIATARKASQSSDDNQPRAGSLLLSQVGSSPEDEFFPQSPRSLGETDVRNTDIEAIVLKFLLNSGPHVGFEIAKHIRLPLTVIRELLRELKEEKLLFLKASAAAGDFVYELT